MKRYAVKINETGKYVSRCNDCWYESIGVPLYLYTKEKALEVVEQMRKHYVYELTIESEDGEKEEIKYAVKKEKKISTGGIQIAPIKGATIKPITFGK